MTINRLRRTIAVVISAKVLLDIFDELLWFASTIPFVKVLLSMKWVEELNGFVELCNVMTVEESWNDIVFVCVSDPTMISECDGIIAAKQTVVIM
jgi:hypothetical protein